MNNLKNMSSHISLDPLALFPLPEYLFNFLWNLNTPPRLEITFKFMVFRLLENLFVSQKKLILTFLLLPPPLSERLLPQVLITSPKTEENKLPIPLQEELFQIYFFKIGEGNYHLSSVLHKRNLAQQTMVLNKESWSLYWC